MSHHRETLAWAAGLFDGEGSAGCYMSPGRTTTCYPRLTLQMTELEPVTRFGAALGIGRLYESSTHRPYHPEHWKPYYRWQLHGFEEVQAAMAMLWPWLSEFKRQQLVQAVKTSV